MITEVIILKSCEPFINQKSNYYSYIPSLVGKSTFFYPIALGHFFYEAGYQLSRDSFDSFLLLYIKSGAIAGEANGQSFFANDDHFVLIDCYKPHSYYATGNCECLWLHFDGPVARSFFDLLIQRFGTVFLSSEGFHAYTKLHTLYEIFQNSKPLREPELSMLINDALTILMLSSPIKKDPVLGFDEILSYINEHYKEDISIDILAQIAHLSPYYFIRCFKKETGFAPHEYLVLTRIQAAKYLLKATNLSIKDICFDCGFTNESIFCTAFKKHVTLTPSEYRDKGLSS